MTVEKLFCFLIWDRGEFDCKSGLATHHCGLFSSSDFA